MKQFFTREWLTLLMVFSALELCLIAYTDQPAIILVILDIQTWGLVLCYWWEMQSRKAAACSEPGEFSEPSGE